MAPSSRMLTLLSLLQSRRDWPGGLLADRLDVSPRTIRRDVERLRDLGYRIRAMKGPDGGYRLDAGSELPPLLFDDEQAVALAVALQAAALTSTGIEESALRALTTVRQVMPPRLRSRLDALQFTAAVDAGAPVSVETLGEVSAAIRAREELRFDYTPVGADPDPARDSGTPSVPRRTQPHHLVATQGRWYLIGWDAQREDWRIFRVDRMRLRSHRGSRFVERGLPGGDAHAFLRARFRGAADGASGWPCVGTVVLHSPASAIAPFAGDAVVTPIDARSCTLSIGAWSWPAVAALVLRFDAELGPVEPRELRAALGALADRALRAAGATSLSPAGS